MTPTSNQAPARCPRCGAPLAGATSGLCLRCVAGTSLLEPAEPGSAEEELAAVLPESLRAASGRVRLGDYELIEEIGRGGMGVVWKARQRSLGRIVAIKMLLFGGITGPGAVQRFQREAASVANLQHPNIVRLLEVGSADNQHFFAMDYVAGPTLAQVVAAGPLGARQAAGYVQIIAEAIQHAHEHGILHRDLKPSNVLIDENDQPRVTDFGLAKRIETQHVPISAGARDGAALDSRSEGLSTDVTVTGQALGSPGFMAPEQTLGSHGKIGLPTDVYGIGAIFYFLLTGRPPFASDTVPGTFSQVLDTDPVPPRRLNSRVSIDAETICLKCLEKEPARRYQTARALAEDLGRFLNHEPIQARPVGLAGKVWRWCRRRPVVAGLGLALHLVALIGAAAVLSQWRRAEANAAGQARERLRAEQQLYVADINRASVELERGEISRARERLAKYLHPKSGEPDPRGFEWRLLWQRTRPAEHRILFTSPTGLNALAFSPEGTLLVAGGDDKTATVIDVGTGRPLKRLTGFNDFIDHGTIAFSPNGQMLAVKGGDQLRVWRTDTWLEMTAPLAGAPSPPSYHNAVAFTPDSRRLAMRKEDGVVGIWSVEDWQQVAAINDTRPGHPLWTYGKIMAFSRDGRLLALTDYSEIQVRDARDLSLVKELPYTSPISEGIHSRIESVAWSMKHLAAGYRDGVLRLWEMGTWREVVRLKPMRSFLKGLDFSQDGSLLATGGDSDLLQLWDVAALAEGRSHDLAPPAWASLAGHANGIACLRFSLDGRSVATTGPDGVVRLWTDWRPDAVPNLAGTLMPISFDHDGRRLLCHHMDGTHQWWDLATRRSLGNVGAPFYPTDIGSGALSPNQEILALVATNQIRLWNVRERRDIGLIDAGAESVTSPVFSPTGDWIAAGVGGGYRKFTLKVWDARSRSEVFRSEEQVTSFALSPDGGWLAFAPCAGGIKLRDLSSKATRQLGSSSEIAHFLDFSPDGKLLAAHAGRSGTIHLIQVESGRTNGRKLLISAMLSLMTQSVFTPEGKTLISRDGDNNITFWSLATGQELMTVKRPREYPYLLMSPDGNALAVLTDTAHQNLGEVELWQAPSLAEIDASVAKRPKPPD